MAVLPHLLRQPGGRLPRVAEDHRLNNSLQVKTVHLHNGARAKRCVHLGNAIHAQKTHSYITAKWHNV